MQAAQLRTDERGMVGLEDVLPAELWCDAVDDDSGGAILLC